MQMRREMTGALARAHAAMRGRRVPVLALAFMGALALGAAALGAQRGGVVIERVGSAQAPAGGAGSAGDDADGAPADEEPLVVDVGGAVMSPGVVRVPAGSRVADAIAAAGGLAADADVSGVNQAAPVADGAKVQVPRIGETAPAASAADGGASAPAPAADPSVAPGGVVNINTAGADELATLPGVGPATARAIIEDRAANGPFAAPEDLMRVSGIGEKRFERMRAQVVV